MAAGAYRYDSGAVCCSKGRVQTDGKREVSEEVGAKLKLEALRRLFELRHRQLKSAPWFRWRDLTSYHLTRSGTGRRPSSSRRKAFLDWRGAASF